MTYANIAVPAGGPWLPSLRTTLTDAGFVLVTQDYALDMSASYTGETIDVYRSPAASNVYGVDWYLILAEMANAAGTTRYLFTTVAEEWDDATKTATRYCPAASGLTPAADGSVGAAGATLTMANVRYNAGLAGANADGHTLGIWSEGANAVIIGNVYAGLLERFQTIALDPVPLIVMSVDNGSTAQSTAYGSSTREPGQAAAHTYNFSVQMSTDLTVNRLYRQTANLEVYSQRQIFSPAACRSSRNVTDSIRGILRGVRIGTVAPAQGDTMTETLPDGTTRTYRVKFTNGSIYTATY